MTPSREFVFQWHVTDRCNLRCSHCYRDGTTRQADLPLEMLLRIGDKLLDAAVRMKVDPIFAITGGEPTLCAALFPLLEHLRSRSTSRIRFLLMTNGVTLARELVERLVTAAPELTTIQVSLDGATPATHDSIRGPGTFHRAVGALQLLAGYPEIKRGISFTYSRANFADVAGIVSLAQELGVDYVYVHRVVPIGAGRAQAEDYLTPQDVRRVIETLRAARERLDFTGASHPYIAEGLCLHHLVAPAEALRRLLGTNRPRLGNRCSVGSSSLCVASDGTLLACRHMPIPLGDLKTQDLLEIWSSSDVLWDIRLRAARMKGKCRTCRFCAEQPALCSGGAACVSHALHGDYFTPDPGCWLSEGAAAHGAGA